VSKDKTPKIGNAVAKFVGSWLDYLSSQKTKDVLLGVAALILLPKVGVPVVAAQAVAALFGVRLAAHAITDAASAKK